MEALAIQPTFEVVHKDFGDFLRNGKKSAFKLDLSKSTAIQVLLAYVKFKSRTKPNFGNTYGYSIRCIERLETDFKITLMPDMITDIFWSYFIDYMSERKVSFSSVATVCSNIRTALRWGRYYGVVTHPSLDNVVIPKVHNEQIALTPDDVSHIYHFDCKLFYKQEEKSRRIDLIKTMEKVRDHFVLSCNLYQRYSDMVRIEPTCFEDDIFRIVQQKTGNTAVVDMRTYCIDYKMTKTILQRYGYYAPYTGDINNYNDYLHTLLKDIGFDELVQISRREKGNIITENIPRWRLISSHTARRTAITNAVLRGDNLHKVKRCSGHSSLNMVDRYVKD